MDTRILIKAPGVFDGVSEQLKIDQYLVVENGVIADTGPQSDLGQNCDAQFDQVIKLDAGQTLLPGLINMHTHVSFSGEASVFEDQLADSDALKMIRIVENLRAALEVGITTIRDCGTWPHLLLSARDAVASGLLRGPRVVASGAITSTGGHCWFCATEADSEDEVRKAVRQHVKDGVDFIKLFATGGNTTPGSSALLTQYTEAQLCAATDEARKAGRRTASHAHAIDGVRTSIKARVTTIEHCSFMTSDGIGWDDAMVSEICNAGIYVCPTVFRGVAKYGESGKFEFTSGDSQFLRRQADRFVLTRRLAAAGVKLVSGNDSGVSHCQIADFPGDLVETVRQCEMSPVAVLRSATSTAAEALGFDDIGVIAKNKVADLLAVAGDPTTDITAIESPAMVMARGTRQALGLR